MKASRKCTGERERERKSSLIGSADKRLEADRENVDEGLDFRSMTSLFVSGGDG